MSTKIGAYIINYFSPIFNQNIKLKKAESHSTVIPFCRPVAASGQPLLCEIVSIELHKSAIAEPFHLQYKR